MKVVVDAFGGDNAPKSIVEGAVDAVNENSKVEVVLVGKEKEINAILELKKFDSKRIEIINATQVITNEDVPTSAIKNKADSSMVVAFDNLKTRDDICGMVSAGSTGAYLTGALLKIGRIKGIARPALSPILPTLTGGNVMLVDAGANVDSKPSFLCDFAVMGSIYMRNVFGIENPRVAILSNGTEDKKGNELSKATFALLKEMNNINFIGNMEARDLISGEYDVVVSDGFSGNICLKSYEGMGSGMMTLLKQGIKSSFKCKIGALLMKKALKNLKNTMDYNTNGGAPFLGVSKIVVKAHGSANSKTIKNTIIQTYEMAGTDFISKVAAELEQNQEKLAKAD